MRRASLLLLILLIRGFASPSLRRFVASSLLLFLLACSARPLKYFGRVVVDGRKGVCHLISHRDAGQHSLRVIAEKIDWARLAGVQITRLPGATPWIMEIPLRLAKLKHILALLDEANIGVQIEVSADGANTLEEWRLHCRQVARELPARWYGILNEPDNKLDWPPERYALWLHVAAEEIRAVRPEALICAPSLGHGKYWSMEAYLNAIDWGTPTRRGDADIATGHPYDDGRPYLERMKKLVPEHIPIWVEEDGSRAWNAAACMRGSLTYLDDERVEVVLWYAFLNDDDDPRWDMLKRADQDGAVVFKPKATFNVFKEIVTR